MSHVTSSPRSALAPAAFVLAALLAAASLGDTTPNAPVNPPPIPPPQGPRPDPEPTAGDPVGYVSGNVYDAVVDVRVPCPDVDLVFKRAYGSWSTRTGTLGYGWSHAYEWYVEEMGDGTLLVYADADPEVSGCAKVHRFTAVRMGGRVFDAAGYSLERALDGGYVFTSPSGKRYEFNSVGKLVSTASWNGTRIDLERGEPSGPVARAIHANGRTLGFSYGDDGLLARVTTPDPAVWIEFAYTNFSYISIDESNMLQFGGRLIPTAVFLGWRYLSAVICHDGVSAATNLYEYSVIPEAGRQVPYVVCPSRPERGYGRNRIPQLASAYMAYSNVVDRARSVLAAKIDANGLGTVYGYVRDSDSPAVRCAYSTMDGGLFETSLEFLYRETVERRPYAGGVIETRLLYDDLERETIRRTAGVEWTYLYDAGGNLARESVVESASGTSLVSDYGYDAAHRVTSMRRTLGGVPCPVRTQVWDEHRRVPRCIVTPEGRIREWIADGHDVVVHGAGTNDARLVTRLFCTTNDRPLAVVLPDGGRIDLSYDTAGYLSGVTASDWPTVSYTRDALGRVASVSWPGPEGARTTSYVRNARGRPLSVVHPDGTSESFAYDGNGTKVVAHVDALGRTDAYRWVLGQPVHASRVVAGTTNVLWSVAHDQQLNVVSLTDPLGRAAETYALDENERIVAVTNLEGQVMTRNYLVSDLVTSATRFDGSSIAYGYDARANLASVAYPDDTLRFTWDGDGLLTSAANAAGIVSNVHDAATGWLDTSRGVDGTAVHYVRSDGGAVTSVVSISGTTAYTLDRAGRRTRIGAPAGTLALGYCPWNGLVAAVTNGNGLVASYAYDVRDRVTNIAWTAADGTPLGGFAYTYDVVGRITARRHALGTNRFDRAYAYDDLDRLAADGSVSYAYDAAGNRTAKTGDVEGAVAYTRGVGDRLASWTGGAYTYDAAGNVTRIVRDGRPTLDLSWNGRYQLVSVSTNGVFAEGYAYDALGRRASTTTWEGTVRYVYDDNWQVIADLDSNGNVLRSYVWGEGIDRLLAVKVGAKSYAALTDVQGTVWGLADGTDVVARWTYDAWGNILSGEVSDPALAAFRYRFQGREFSAVTGLTNFRMRWYDPRTGRWLSRDPIRLLGGLNLYAFCENSPNNRHDPRGFFAIAVGVTGSAGAVSGVGLGSGIVIGYSKKCGFTSGRYKTGSIGSHIGMSASLGVSLTVFPGADSVNDMAGTTSNAGGSGKALLGGGVEVSVPLDGNIRGIGISISGGVGAGGEGHVTISHTVVE